MAERIWKKNLLCNYTQGSYTQQNSRIGQPQDTMCRGTSKVPKKSIEGPDDPWATINASFCTRLAYYMVKDLKVCVECTQGFPHNNQLVWGHQPKQEYPRWECSLRSDNLYYRVRPAVHCYLCHTALLRRMRLINTAQSPRNNDQRWDD